MGLKMVQTLIVIIYLGPMNSHCLSSHSVQLLSVKLGSSAVVLLLGVLGENGCN